MTAVTLCECFARDGLQHEDVFVPTAVKVELIDRFARLGFRRIEATSYSNPTVVPQFADASDVLRGMHRVPDVRYKATCANVRAVERAVVDAAADCGANEISLLVSASESHSERNLRRSRAAQWTNVAGMVTAAAGRFRMIGTISVAFGCPFEGAVDARSVIEDVRRFHALGVDFVALGDTTGMANPATVRELFGAVRAQMPRVEPIAHFHDTRGTGLANYVAALNAGVTFFDCAFGGVGGHPSRVKYGGGHTGNVATEDLVSLFESMGIDTGIDLDQLVATALACEAALGRELQGRVARAGINPLIRRGV